jgi:hypothetical protein
LVEAKFDEQNTLSRSLELEKNEAREIHLALDGQPAPTPEPAQCPSPLVVYRERPEPDRQHQSASLFGVGFELSGSNIPKPYAQSIFTVGASFEKRFLYRFGIRAKAGYDVGTGVPSSNQSSQSTATTPSDPRTLTGFSYGVGLPIYLSGEENSVYVMPEFGAIGYVYGNSSSGSNPEAARFPDISYAYSRRGVTVGYQDPSWHLNLYASFYDYDWGVAGHHSTGVIGLSFIFGK